MKSQYAIERWKGRHIESMFHHIDTFYGIKFFQIRNNEAF